MLTARQDNKINEVMSELDIEEFVNIMNYLGYGVYYNRSGTATVGDVMNIIRELAIDCIEEEYEEVTTARINVAYFKGSEDFKVTLYLSQWDTRLYD